MMSGAKTQPAVLSNVQAISQDKKWVIINDSIYDVEHYIDEHPGGPEVLENILGSILH